LRYYTRKDVAIYDSEVQYLLLVLFEVGKAVGAMSRLGRVYLGLRWNGIGMRVMAVDGAEELI
jgi:hypothetical protein